MKWTRTMIAAAMLSHGAGALAQAPGPAPVIPTRVSAQTLATICAETRTPCLTYVLGVADAFSVALAAAGRPRLFCLPAGTTNDQVTDAVIAYLGEHPEEARSNAAAVVFAGLTARFPCS